MKLKQGIQSIEGLTINVQINIISFRLPYFFSGFPFCNKMLTASLSNSSESSIFILFHLPQF